MESIFFWKITTVFPFIVSVETFLFWTWKFQKIQIVVANFNYLLNKLNFCCVNYVHIQGRKLYEERQYRIFISPFNITGHIFQAFNISNPIYKAAIVPNYAVNSAVIFFEKLNFPVIRRCSVPFQFRIELIVYSKKRFPIYKTKIKVSPWDAFTKRLKRDFKNTSAPWWYLGCTAWGIDESWNLIWYSVQVSKAKAV